MTDQLEIIPDPVPVEPGTRLSVRQRMALDYIASVETPVSDDELGALMHEERRSRGGRGHSRDARCQWCGEEGRQIGEALEAKGLLAHVRHEGWKIA